MDNKLTKLLKKMETSLAAASFAEEGESEAARSFMKEERRVLLAVKQGKIDPKTVKYAVNTTKRIGASLDILFVSPDDSEPAAVLPHDFMTELSASGVGFRVVPRTGCLKQAVIDYTDREKDILFAVVESPNSLNADCNRRDTRISELWQKLKCPLVVVMEEA